MLRSKLKMAGRLDLNYPEELKPKESQELRSTSEHFATPFWAQFYNIECALNTELRSLQFGPKITHVYNPVEYAGDLHCNYLRKYLKGPKNVMLVGMNPGPNGMAQTGVPFGNIITVRDWMGLRGTVNQPEKIHPKRLVTGLSCYIDEPSGVRFWTVIKNLSGSLDTFSEQCFMHNFCPLAFFNSTGQNITPSELKGDEKKKVRDICLQYFEQEIELVRPSIIIAVGNYVDECFRILSKQAKYNRITFLKLPHPSPRSVNNNNWHEKAQIFFDENDLVKYLQNQFMNEAFAEARAAQSIGEVPVGCVFVYKNEIIGRGGNYVNATKNATRHAEFVCIDQVLQFCKELNLNCEKVFADVSVVVTVEPCIMCASALCNLGVKEVLYGCANDRFGGKTVLNVSNSLGSDIRFKGGYKSEEAMGLLKEFYKGINPAAPVPKVKKTKN